MTVSTVMTRGFRPRSTAGVAVGRKLASTVPVVKTWIAPAPP